MEIFVVPAFLVFAMFCIYKQQQWRERQLTKQTPAPKKQEEPIEKVIERIKDNNRQDNKKDRQQWEKDYLTTLPLEEHPDYFTPSPDDDVETTQVRDGAGNVLRNVTLRTNFRGKPYQTKVDHITKTITIYCGDIHWELPLDEYRFLLDK